jgi:alkylation response protein AidB-like acyl-CoA dehydrogenase
MLVLPRSASRVRDIEGNARGPTPGRQGRVRPLPERILARPRRRPPLPRRVRQGDGGSRLPRRADSRGVRRYGLDLSAACAILEEVNRSGANAGPAHAQMYTMGTLLRHGSEEQKQAYLPKVSAGELRLRAFGVTEPEAGTDTAPIRATARREGDHYVVNGRKRSTSPGSSSQTS